MPTRVQEWNVLNSFTYVALTDNFFLINCIRFLFLFLVILDFYFHCHVTYQHRYVGHRAVSVSVTIRYM